ncbi:MAG TPA: cupin [Polyangiaceae bacterium LLY-WYZ-15_(1-7)]|nr:cupin [Myxococcales bacterium]MAT26856.1 cupin [Sandaracinus sp.]HJK91054.1 cupin [Polyangiaceae bacterium LLY-WYZ-15_(1-7)]MBJ69913.1 cupin [Sandaracinus sp.]HJL02726.1 cupin [Polyangiaceae bacterium LLY-WYZ-15_(1-7)]
MGYRIVDEPTRIPVPGDKLIEEMVGRVNTGHETLSVAHMVAPPGWGEPAQTPEFLEVTVMLRGTMRVELGPAESLEVVDVKAGQTIVVEAGTRVRYANPHDEENEYWAICVPAFSPEAAHREED